MMTAPLYKPVDLDDPKTIALAAEQARLITRIRNLFEIEGWSTERISEAVELPRSEVIRLIQTTTPKKTEAL